MHPEEIKAAIRMKGTTPSVIADELEISRTTVSQVIHGRGVSARVANRISEVLGLPVAKIWPAVRPTLVRRTKTKKPHTHKSECPMSGQIEPQPDRRVDPPNRRVGNRRGPKIAPQAAA